MRQSTGPGHAVKGPSRARTGTASRHWLIRTAGRAAPLVVAAALLCSFGCHAARPASGAPEHRVNPDAPRLLVLGYPDSGRLNMAAADSMSAALQALSSTDSLWVITRRAWITALAIQDLEYITRLDDYRAMARVLGVATVVLLRAEEDGGGIGFTAWTLRPARDDDRHWLASGS